MYDLTVEKERSLEVVYKSSDLRVPYHDLRNAKSTCAEKSRRDVSVARGHPSRLRQGEGLTPVSTDVEEGGEGQRSR